MKTLVLIAGLVLGYNTTVYAPGAGQPFYNPYSGTLAADSGVFATVAADAGYIGGTLYSNHIGMTAGSPAPTCGAYQNVQNPFDGGGGGSVVCGTGSTDMNGTIVATSGSSTASTAETALLYVQPGTAWTSGARCLLSGSFSSNEQMIPEMDAGANALQLSTTLTAWTASTKYVFPYICFGK